ncbi:MAG TPA: hypothetical protein VF756_22220 [Thermoanaerobaculia bacterium]
MARLRSRAFELGLAYAISREHSHRFIVFETREHRLQASLSDLNGYDPQIHDGTATGVLGLLDCFGTLGNPPNLKILERLTAKLTRAVLELQGEHGLSHPFYPFIYRQTVLTAISQAKRERLID